MGDGWGGERQIGKDLSEIEPKHVARYEYAQTFIMPDMDMKVLDAACGCGYGSSILAKRAREVVGVDISNEAIDYAIANYQKENIIFRKYDLQKLDIRDLTCIINYKYPLSAFYDVVVAFELIEHLKTSIRGTLSKFNDLLSDGGILIISHPENEQPPGGKFHSHTGIKGDDVRKMLEALEMRVIASWLQPGRFTCDYHIQVAYKY